MNEDKAYPNSPNLVTDADSLVFRDKSFLDTLTTPAGLEISGREEQTKLLRDYLNSFRGGLVVPFISIYGKSGTGKSAAVEQVCATLEKEGLLTFRFVNLRRARTVFGCANAILFELGGSPLKSADGMSIALERIEEAIGKILVGESSNANVANDNVKRPIKKKLFVLVLDEFDVLFQRGRRGDASDFIFSLLLIEEELRKSGWWMCIVAISNKLVSDYPLLDDRVRSRIGSSEIYFPAYRTKQLVQILEQRQAAAFSQPLESEILERCALLSSAHHGDARRAIELLRTIGELLELQQLTAAGRGEGSKVRITKTDVDNAFAQLQKDSISQVIKSLPRQLVFVVAALVRLGYLTDGKWHSTTVLLRQYEDCMGRAARSEINPLSRRRFAEALTELENLGLVETKRTSEGRYGYQALYRITEEPKLLGETCFGGEWWDEIVKSKGRRVDFLTSRSFRKVDSDYTKTKRRFPTYDETQFTEMNDHNWKTFVYGNPGGTF